MCFCGVVVISKTTSICGVMADLWDSYQGYCSVVTHHLSLGLLLSLFSQNNLIIL